MGDTVPSFVAIAHDFTRHPKLIALGDSRQRWVWLGVLCYAVEYRTDGVIPDDIGDVVKGASASFLAKCRSVGLLDFSAGKLVIHDYDEYNGSARERLQARERKRRQRELDRLERVTEESRLGHGESHEEVTPRGRAPSPLPLPEDLENLSERLLQTVDGEPSSRTAADDIRAELLRDPPKRGSGWVENLNSYTGCRLVRGTHAHSAVYDPLGTEPPPADWPYARPSREEIRKALDASNGVTKSPSEAHVTANPHG